jgi:hypothetical protein
MGTFPRTTELSPAVRRYVLLSATILSSLGLIAAPTVAAPRPEAVVAREGIALPAERPAQTMAMASATQNPDSFQQMLFVHPVVGSDTEGEGTLRSPFRSITHAVRFADTNFADTQTVIMLAGGTYDQRSGEQFPITLPPGVRLLEMPNVTVSLRGDIVTGESLPAPAPAPSTTEPDPETLPTVETPQPAASFAPPVVPAVEVAPSTEAIAIPVPPPVRPSPPVAPPAQQPSPLPAAPIEIPVPPPANPQAAVGRSDASLGSPAQVTPGPLPTPAAPPQINVVVPRPTAPPNPNLLPVPDPNAPLGYVGDLPTVSLERLGIPALPPEQTAAPPLAAVRSPAPHLRYRVIVRLESDALRDWIHAIMPDAFETTINGEPVMQIGAFQTVDNAEAAAEMLNQNGVRAIIQEF